MFRISPRLAVMAGTTRATLGTTAEYAVRLPEGALAMVQLVPVEVVWAGRARSRRLLYNQYKQSQDAAYQQGLETGQHKAKTTTTTPAD